tara:strand:+ start:167 stop:3262 length:3096 start_codon:yes stop_codon:yes gene_type:complete
MKRAIVIISILLISVSFVFAGQNLGELLKNSGDVANGGFAVEDFDGDLQPNIEDDDMDNDGIEDIFENQEYPDSGFIYDRFVNFDGDSGTFGIFNDFPNVFDLDSDNDCILDIQERTNDGKIYYAYGIKPQDADNDGSPNFLDDDSDNDGMSDYEESDLSNPYKQSNNPINAFTNALSLSSAYYSDDLDMLPGLTSNRCPFGNDLKDTDGDGIPNPYDNDDDNDGIPSLIDPAPYSDSNDEDGDGIFDQDEWDTNGDGTGPDDTDGDGIPDYLDSDGDNDGVDDSYEFSRVTNLNSGKQYLFEIGNFDTDNDGLYDGYEYAYTDNGQSSSVLLSNDLCEPDSDSYDTDGDGISDRDEVDYWTDCSSADTDKDGISDYDEVNSGTNPLDACSGPNLIISDPYVLNNPEIKLSARGSLPKGFEIVFSSLESTGITLTGGNNNFIVWEFSGAGNVNTNIATVGTGGNTDSEKGAVFTVPGDYTAKLKVSIKDRNTGNMPLTWEASNSEWGIEGPGIARTSTCVLEETLNFEIDDAQDFSPFSDIFISEISLNNVDDELQRKKFGGSNYPINNNLKIIGNFTVKDSNTLTTYQKIEIKDPDGILIHPDTYIPKAPGDPIINKKSGIEFIVPANKLVKEGTHTIEYSVGVESGDGLIFESKGTSEFKLTSGMVLDIGTSINSLNILPGQQLTYRISGYHFTGLFKQIVFDLGSRDKVNGEIFEVSPGTGTLGCKISKDSYCTLSSTDFNPVYEGEIPVVGAACGCTGTIYAGQRLYDFDTTDQINSFEYDIPFSYDSKESCGSDRVCQVELETTDMNNKKTKINLNILLPQVQTCPATYENSIVGENASLFVGLINDGEQKCICKSGYKPKIESGLSALLGSTKICEAIFTQSVNDTEDKTINSGRGASNIVSDMNRRRAASSVDNSNLLSNESSEKGIGLIIFGLFIVLGAGTIGGFEYYEKKKTGSYVNPFNNLKTLFNKSKKQDDEITNNSNYQISPIQKFITKARTAGESNDTIKQNLINSGWPEEEIDKYL